MLPSWIWIAVFAAGLLILWLNNKRLYPHYEELLAQAPELSKISKWLPWMLSVMRRFQPTLDTHPMFMGLRQAIFQFYGPHEYHNRFRLITAELGFYLYGGLLIGPLLAAITDGSLMNMIGGLVLGIILPLAKWKDVLNRAERKRQDLQLELPELLSKLTLLVQAGETVPRALQTCLDRKRGELHHPLYVELDRMLKDVANGYAFPQAMEQFAKRCAIQEAAMFSTTLLINQKRGGQSFVLAMEDLGRQLWEKRKAVARMRGEEASTKLIFPMMLMFIVLLALVGGPALLMMK
ncbi:type II secretion system F family protein [Paenibacillus sp. 1001270B_150601_E10]|uniref:type II secretion system F family protein n=1 Tax=Paenibacillus sp. 1001270B_150601_E10 TaxID=2787079 RepID=UPI00189F4518|nr:type II secretion system F family protein [Paenibacillus sp. 1001270B_150601_E10]